MQLKKEIRDYLKDNIESINKPNFDYDATGKCNGFDSLNNLKEFLRRYLYEWVNKPNKNKQKLIDELEKKNFTKNKIVEIANKYLFYKGHLQKFYDSIIQYEVIDELNESEFQFVQLAFIKAKVGKPKFNFVKTNLNKLLSKQLQLLKTNGFKKDIIYINKGTMDANSGDSAQFLFLSRAIQAGFNCSNVDVRSSRYDAVIDYEDTLLRIQIKGISGESISFIDRDRGGAGIDHTAASNKGSRITSKDCEIYAAVDKLTGLCYIIPVKKVIDPLDDDKLNLKIKNAESFLENWDTIKTIATSIKRTS